MSYPVLKMVFIGCMGLMLQNIWEVESSSPPQTSFFDVIFITYNWTVVKNKNNTVTVKNQNVHGSEVELLPWDIGRSYFLRDERKWRRRICGQVSNNFETGKKTLNNLLNNNDGLL